MQYRQGFDQRRRKALNIIFTGSATVPLSSLPVQRKACSEELVHLTEEDAMTKA